MASITRWYRETWFLMVMSGACRATVELADVGPPELKWV